MSKSIYNYRNYCGTDESLSTSLFEYGLLVSKEKDKDNQYTIVYGVSMTENGYETFDTTFMSEDEIVEIFNESWFDKTGFLDCIDCSESDFLDMSIVQKLFNIKSYHGCNNIFGSSYFAFEITPSDKVG